ncbi:UNVERIFIED_CONTAM: hypothetical protein Slati_0451100 [Sesamum latifolium]|uniref:Transposase n=1 Tax=Sesamum latifolium TaxID=2727402 RepID=A0AAW2XVU3_9LAMI
MYEKNLPTRAGLTPEFQDGVTAFIEWAKSQYAYMDGEKIRYPCRKSKNKVFKIPDEDEQTPPAPAEEGTSTHWGNATEMNCAQRMVFDAVGQAYNQDGAEDDGTRSCPLDAGPSSYYHGAGPYDYVSGLADRFHDVLHAVEQSLWNSCITSQLVVVAELVDMKADGQLSERIYDRISQWSDHIIPHDHSFSLGYYNTKKLIKDLSLPVEKIDACKNGCMLYWKDNIDLDYCKFCGEARYKPTKRNPNRTKTPYAVLRIRRESKGLHDSLFARKALSRFCGGLPSRARSIPCVQSGRARFTLNMRSRGDIAVMSVEGATLYASQVTAEQMTWHANHQMEEGSMCHPSDVEAWRHFDPTHPDFAVEPRNVRLGL